MRKSCLISVRWRSVNCFDVDVNLRSETRNLEETATGSAFRESSEF